ncbi:MAG: PDZ domain-containing protein [Planctomycetes bacterium]|nr:PDZ domain-containing protein [Planctomycetota bacterium]
MKIDNLHFHVGFDRPSTHKLKVALTFTPAEVGETIIQFPVWTPGHYKIKDYARNVMDLRSSQGTTLEKLDKHRWKLSVNEKREVKIEYEVYGFDLTVRTTYYDDEFCHTLGSNLFFELPDFSGKSIGLSIDVPEGFRLACPLDPASKSGGPRTENFTAPDFDVLFDTPFIAGKIDVREFEAGGVSHSFAMVGGTDVNIETLVLDTKAIVDYQIASFGGAPYKRYLFIMIFTDGYGGLEHLNSTSLLGKGFLLGDREQYHKLIGLISHEFFHVWNVKRIRAQELGPFDYARENYTSLLWLMEGVTNYYDERMLLGAKRITGDEYLAYLADAYKRYLQHPGRRHKTLAETSIDTWQDQYIQDEYSKNRSISYYLRGELAALVFDLHIHRDTNGERSFFDVMLKLWQIYRSDPSQGFPEEIVRRGIGEVAGRDYRALYDSLVHSKEDYPIVDSLKFVGANLHPKLPEKPAGGSGTAVTAVETHGQDARATEKTEGDLGIEFEDAGGFVKIKNVPDGSAADLGGLSAKDVIVAIDEVKANSQTFEKRIRSTPAGTTLRFSLLRNDRLISVSVTLGAGPGFTDYVIDTPDDADDDAKRLRNIWLYGIDAKS